MNIKSAKVVGEKYLVKIIKHMPNELETTAGGLFKPVNSSNLVGEKPTIGELVQTATRDLNIGDIVMLCGFSGEVLYISGEEHRIVKMEEILAIVEIE